MNQDARHSRSMRQLWHAHRRLVAAAPASAWCWFAACWLVLSLLRCGALLFFDVGQQRDDFEREARALTVSVQNRLESCELVLYGMEDLIAGQPQPDYARLSRYAEEAAKRYRYLYTMGFQPRIAQAQRRAFEAGKTGTLPLQILDYRHDADDNANWQHPSAWQPAPVRDSYLPWVMAVPQLTSRGQRALGLDLQADSIVGPTVRRALRSGEIEISRPLRLMDNGTAIAYFHALYSPSPPSPSPILRPDEAIGVSMLLVRTDALVSLEPEQARWLSVSLARQDSVTNRPGVPVYEWLATNSPDWLDRMLPRLERRAQVDTPYFPYELRIAQQLRFSMISDRSLAAAWLLSIPPSYLIFLILAIRHRARKSQEYADDSLYRTRENSTVTLQAISDAVVTIDNGRKVQYLNPAAAHLLETSEARAIGRPLTEVFKLRYEFARHAIADPFIECLQQRKVLELEENSFLLRPNGEKLLIEGTVSPLFDRNGGLIGGVLTFRDTAPLRRRMLEALEASEARLKQHENELARVARITSMGEMASGIAHEINQPLSAIMSYCQASLSLLEEEEPNLKLIATAIQSAVNQADRAGKIVRRLREFVSKGERHHTPVDVNHVVTNALTMAEYDLHSQKVDVEYLPGSHVPLVFADTIQLEQVVLNLVRNAIDAMQSAPGPHRLMVETSFSAERVCIKVGDNGPGIGSDKLDSIFAPFFSTKTSGMGLGLTICQTIVESFGGRISAHNRSANGAEFVVELPPLDTTFGQHTTTDTE